jgi:acyl-CoA synthetase (NDP forming)
LERTIKNLDFLFKPRSVAFVGATETMNKWGFIIFNNLISGGYEGSLYPVNPGRDSVLGHKAYPTVRDIPGEVDMAVFTVPARSVVEAMDDCLAKGVKAGMVISAGFGEMGGEHEDLEAELVRKARAGEMALAGPNGAGVCCPSAKLFAWMPSFYPPSGHVGVISQSGNVLGMLIGHLLKCGFGVSKGVSSGNEAALRTEDYFEYLAGDPDTGVILSYQEGITDGRRFLERARSASSKKPVVILKGGRTDSGFAAARSHTGAMAVEDNLFDSVCRQAGLVRAGTIEEAGIIATSFINRPLPRGKRVGIVTGGGGLGVIASDTCSELGLDVVKLSSQTIEKIGKLMPGWWVPGNPVDLVAGLNFASIMPIINILMNSGEVDAVMLLFIGPPSDSGQGPAVTNAQSERFKKMWKSMSGMFKAFGEAMTRHSNELQVPVYVVSNFQGREDYDVNEMLGENRMTIFPTIESACTAISAMAMYKPRS